MLLLVYASCMARNTSSGHQATPFLGLVSDTHGFLARGVLQLLQGADRILHAGDVGEMAVLKALEALAPVTVVRGNVDFQGAALPPRELAMWSGLRIGLLHDAGSEGIHAWAFAESGRLDLVVCGHSHRHGVCRRGSVALVNPGAAGPSRFGLPQTAARLVVSGGACRVEWFDVASRPVLIDAEEQRLPDADASCRRG